eukprot:14021155-Ditylum_brightwellii.AAC.1
MFIPLAKLTGQFPLKRHVRYSHIENTQVALSQQWHNCTNVMLHVPEEGRATGWKLLEKVDNVDKKAEEFCEA